MIFTDKTTKLLTYFELISDIDECATTNPCQQKCKNTVGSFQCFCNVGYIINPENPNKCIATCRTFGCVNGQCTEPDICQCHSGYQGNNCNAGNLTHWH